MLFAKTLQSLLQSVTQKIAQPKWQWLLIAVFLVCVGVALRGYQVTTIPSGLTWDEAAIGYNGWAVWETRRDEWFTILPISFRSFGDYKAPFAIYVVGFFTQIFGLSVLAVRLPFVLFGGIAIIGIGWVTYEWLSWIHSRTYSKSHFFALTHDQKLGLSVLAMTLLTFSPWHLHLSRAGFESGLALTWVLMGLAAYFRAVRTAQYPWLFFWVTCWVGSLYTYHSSKIVVPILGLVLLGFTWKFWAATLFGCAASLASSLEKKQASLLTWKKRAGIGIGITVYGTLLLLPLLYDSFFKGGATRLTQTSVLTADISVLEKISLIVSNFYSHFTFSFLVQGGVFNYRQGMGDWGVLLPTSFVLFSIGICMTFWYVRKRQEYRLFLFPFLFVIVGLLPASLGLDEVPHTIRGLLALPGIILLIVAVVYRGSYAILNWSYNKKTVGSHGETNIVYKAILGTTLLIYLYSVLAMTQTYFSEFPARSADSFNAQYLEAMEVAHAYATGSDGYPKKEKIMVSSQYGQPYIYALFANSIHPFSYRDGVFINYEFTEITVGDLLRENAVIVATAKDEYFLPERADYILYDKSGAVRFMIFVTE